MALKCQKEFGKIILRFGKNYKNRNESNPQ